MKVFTSVFNSAVRQIPLPQDFSAADVDLLIVHGIRATLEYESIQYMLQKAYPNAVITGCSTAGELEGGMIHHNSVVFAALSFEKSEVKQVSRQFSEEDCLNEAVRDLAGQLAREDLKGVVVYIDGLALDSDEVVCSLGEALDPAVKVIGGLAADSLGFEDAKVITRGGAFSRSVTLTGLYGDSLELTSTCSEFPASSEKMVITRSEGNMIFEIDHQPAYQVYRLALENRGYELPRDVTYFPLMILDDLGCPLMPRSVLQCSEEAGTVLCASAISEGSVVSICDLSNPQLIVEDAKKVIGNCVSAETEFVLVINCVGRRITLGPASEGEEAEVVARTAGHHLP
ncbi:MAG: FIST N-terminal domain-containing protein [Verrucomicrobiota bacterium]